jgi:hypothetical protein
MANGEKMINVAALRGLMFATLAWVVCAICMGQTAPTIQGHGGGPSNLESRSVSGTFFFGTSHDAKLGPLAWFIHLDENHRTGEMFVAPRMMKFSKLELREDGTLTFQSPVFVGKEYRFRGTLKSEAISGEMQLVNANSGDPLDKWELAIAALPPSQNSRTASAQQVGNVQYSNTAYSSEGGDQTGTDIRFFSTGTATTGMIVFYESYWGEPTFTPLAFSQVTLDKGVIHFAVDLPSGVARYHLRQTPTGGLFNRDDVSHTADDKDIALKTLRSAF